MKALAALVNGMATMIEAGIYDNNFDTVQRTAIEMQEAIANAKNLTEDAMMLAYEALQVFNNAYALEVLDRETFDRDSTCIQSVRNMSSDILTDIYELLYRLMADSHNHERIYNVFCAAEQDTRELVNYIEKHFVIDLEKVPVRVLGMHLAMPAVYESLIASFRECEDSAYDLYETEREEFNKQNPTAYGYQNLYGSHVYPGQDATHSLLGMFSNYETVSKSISELIYTLKELHGEFGGDLWKIEDQLRSTCIVADAYCCAVRAWNGGGYDMIPASSLVWDIIRLKIERFSKRGAIFSEEILDAIKPLEKAEA